MRTILVSRVDPKGAVVRNKLHIYQWYSKETNATSTLQRQGQSVVQNVGCLTLAKARQNRKTILSFTTRWHIQKTLDSAFGGQL